MKILKILLSWPALAVEAAFLAWWCWPWANHVVGIFWIIITAAVLIGELYAYIRTKKTVSANVQEQAKLDAFRFWVMIAAWLLFSFTLAGHFMLKLF
jgi:hypothetical protein